MARSLTLPNVHSRERYTLDAAGNIVDTDSGVAVTFSEGCGEPETQSRNVNNLNQLTSVTGNSVAYDARGNLTTYGGLTYSYDGFNRMIGVSGNLSLAP